VEYLDPCLGDVDMLRPNDALIWGYRFLFVLLYIAIIIPMGYWSVPFTMPYFIAWIALLIPLIFSREELLEYDVHKCTLVNLEVGVPKCVLMYLFVHPSAESIT